VVFRFTEDVSSQSTFVIALFFGAGTCIIARNTYRYHRGKANVMVVDDDPTMCVFLDCFSPSAFIRDHAAQRRTP
jgi:hypothetical protein